jgi:hypothetical protein
MDRGTLNPSLLSDLEMCCWLSAVQGLTDPEIQAAVSRPFEDSKSIASVVNVVRP